MKRKTYILWKRRLTVFLAFLVVGGALYAYGWTNAFVITSFSFSGVEEKDRPALTEELFSATRQNTWYVFPGDKILTWNGKRLKATVRKQLPNTAKVSIYPKGLHTLFVVVTPHVPMFRTDEGMAVDTTGVVYKEQNDIHAFPLISFSTTTTEASFLSAVSSLVPKITMLLFPVSRVVIDQYGDTYLFSGISSSTIILAKTADFNKVWLTLVSAVDTDPLKTSLETKKEKLEYIDLRFGNKVFYKFTNDGKPVIIAPHATTTATTTLQ